MKNTILLKINLNPNERILASEEIPVPNQNEFQKYKFPCFKATDLNCITPFWIDNTNEGYPIKLDDTTGRNGKVGKKGSFSFNVDQIPCQGSIIISVINDEGLYGVNVSVWQKNTGKFSTQAKTSKNPKSIVQTQENKQQEISVDATAI